MEKLPLEDSCVKSATRSGQELEKRTFSVVMPASHWNEYERYRDLYFVIEAVNVEEALWPDPSTRIVLRSVMLTESGRKKIDEKPCSDSVKLLEDMTHAEQVEYRDRWVRELPDEDRERGKELWNRFCVIVPGSWVPFD